MDQHEDREQQGARYAWAEARNDLVTALSITLVQPADGAALAELRPRRELPGTLTVAQALDATDQLDDFAWGSVLAQVDRLDNWDVIIEPNGWAASMPETLARLSTNGIAITVFWNVNAAMQFALARAGTVTRVFDPLLYHAEDDRLPEEASFRWGVGAPRASGLGLMERLTGVALDRDWLLGRARRTFVVPL